MGIDTACMVEEVPKDSIKQSVVESEASERMLEKRKPDLAVRCLEMLADGVGYRKVKKETGLSFNAIASLKGRHKEALEVRREELAKDGFELLEKYRLLLNMKLEGLAEDSDLLKKEGLKDLHTGYAILQDKALQAVEGNKVTVVHRKEGPSLEDAMAAIQEAQKRVKGEAIDV